MHVMAAIAGGNAREDFRVVHFSVMSNHIHLICEAHGNKALALGMRGIGGRVAKKVNKVLGRKGRVIADRYHAHVLHTRAEVRNAVRYVLRNAERHDVLLGVADSADSADVGGRAGDRPGDRPADRPGAWWTRLDPLSSAAAFPYWLEATVDSLGRTPEVLVAGMGALVRPAQCALFRIAFDGAPLALLEELPAARRRAADRRVGSKGRARVSGGFEIRA